MGIERLLITLENLHLLDNVKDTCPTVYIAPLGEDTSILTSKIVNDLRVNGISVETDLVGRSVKAQMKYANKINAKYVIVVGSNEIENNLVNVKEMETGETVEVKLNELVPFLKEKVRG